MRRNTITGNIAAITFLCAGVALQLYFNEDHYFAMNRAKCSFSMIVLICAFITALVRPIERFWRTQDKQKMTLLDWCVLTFGCSSIITCILSQSPELTFVGTKGMFVGAFTYLTGMLTYFVVSRNFTPTKWIVGILILAWTLIFLWTIVNQCGTDVFGMHQNMKPGDERGYVSSMGNTNSASDAFATMIPFIVIITVMAFTETRRLILLIVCFLGLMGAYSLRDEGVLIGLFTMLPYVIITTLSDIKMVERAIKLVFVMGMSLAVYHFLCICTIIDSPQGMIYTVSNYWVGEFLSVLAFVMFVLHNNNKLDCNEKTLRYARVVLEWTCFIMLAVFILVSVVKSVYDPNYGSGRGAIWKGNIWTFRLYKPIEMIFGQGSGMFAQNATLARSMLLGDTTSKLSFATSHNSLLQALLGNGIIGLLCLLTGVYALLRDWFRDLRPIVLRPMSKYESIRNVEFNEVVRVASFVAIMGYFGASLVESTYPHTVMLLFAMLALYRSSYFVPRKKKEKKVIEEQSK